MNSNTPNLDMYNDDSLNISFFITLIQKNIKFIVTCAVITASLTGIYAFTLPNLYTAGAVMNSPESNQTYSSNLNAISNIAGLKVDGNSTKADEAIEIIKSFKFFDEIILENFPISYFTDEIRWDKEINKLIINTQDISLTKEEAHRNFLKNNLIIGKDDETSFTFLGITHVSPYEATNLTNFIIGAANKIFSQREYDKSEIALNYMQSKVEGTIVSELRAAFAEIMKMHTQKLAFIESNTDYVFQVLSPAHPPDLKSGPFRSLYILLAALFGGMLAVVISYLKTVKLDSEI